MHGTPYFSTARPLARVWMSESLHHAPPRPLGTWWRCTCTVYVCEDMLGMLKLMLGAIVLHHTRVTPLLGAAHRPREARGTFKVNNPCPTRRATSRPYLPVARARHAPRALRDREQRDPYSLGRGDAAHRAPTHSISLESGQGPLFYGSHSRPLHSPSVAAPKLSSHGSATDSFPSTPCLASRFATRPDDFASATNESRNATAASQAAASPRGVPIAWDRAGVVCHLMQYQCIGRFR